MVKGFKMKLYEGTGSRVREKTQPVMAGDEGYDS